MKDVALKAGVSLGTVSNVLNGKDSVLPENRAKVLRVVERLKFRSNLVARTLRTKSSKDIGLIIPNINNPFYPELARGVEDAANKAGFTVLLCNDDRDVRKERSYIKSLMAKKMYGIVLLKPQISRAEAEEIALNMAMVLMDARMPAGSACNVVNVDDRGGIVKGMRFLRRHGHAKIGFIKGLADSLSSHDRVKAYREFLKDEGLPLRREYIFPGDYSLNGGCKAARALLTLSDPPTAIASSNDLMALGCLKEAQRMGLDVPGDVSVIGYDNLDLANFCTPRLTTINQPKYEMGVKGVELLLRNFPHGPGLPGEVAVLPTEVVERESAGPARAR
jgi:DNA-binding LacI/PurR family transcriptional regulator